MAVRSIRCPQELFDALDAEAETRDVSTNWLIVKILSESLDRGLAPLERLRVTT
jgi:hypothetical protein